MAEEHTTLNEEKLTQVIRKIFQEEFKKQEVHITNIISSIFKITVKEIKKSQEQIKELKKEVTDLKSSVEHTDADLNDLSDRVDEIYDYQVDPEYVTNKLIDLEDRSRRNNLRIDGISESRNGSREECEEEIQKVFNGKLGVENVQIERAHRSKRSKRNNNSEKPRTIETQKDLREGTFLSMRTFVMKRCNIEKSYGKKSKIYEVKAKLPILIIDQ